MTDNELKKLNRTELLKLLIEQATEIENLKGEIAQAKEALASREIKLQKAGSIAEASLAVSGIFSAAQEAAEIYLENIRNAESDGQKIVDDAKAEAAQIVDKANSEAAEVVAAAKIKAEAYWQEVSEKLERFYDAHMGLREMLSIGNKSKWE